MQVRKCRHQRSAKWQMSHLLDQAASCCPQHWTPLLPSVHNNSEIGCQPLCSSHQTEKGVKSKLYSLLLQFLSMKRNSSATLPLTLAKLLSWFIGDLNAAEQATSEAHSWSLPTNWAMKKKVKTSVLSQWIRCQEISNCNKHDGKWKP